MVILKAECNVYTCHICEDEGGRDMFITDIECDQEQDEMTCENCYDEMDSSCY